MTSGFGTIEETIEYCNEGNNELGMFIQDSNATENAEGGEDGDEDDDYREDDESDQGGELHSATKSFTALHHRQHGLATTGYRLAVVGYQPTFVSLPKQTAFMPPLLRKMSQPPTSMNIQ